MFECHGYGRAYPPGRRQIVGAVFHLSDTDRYRRLNDAVCVWVGEVREPADPNEVEPDLVLDVAELIWEPDRRLTLDQGLRRGSLCQATFPHARVPKRSPQGMMTRPAAGCPGTRASHGPSGMRPALDDVDVVRAREPFPNPSARRAEPHRSRSRRLQVARLLADA